MGGLASGIGKTALGIQSGGQAGDVGALGDTFGLSGKQGEYYTPGGLPQLRTGAEQQLANQGDIQNSGTAAGIYGGYGSGAQNEAQTLAAIQGQPAGDQTSLMRGLATGPVTGSRLATDEVQGNSILGGLFGQGGQLQQAENQYTDLANNGFQLGPTEQTAYGQQAGNISRLMGQQSNAAGQNLAMRGLSNSGAAGATFSGLQGNQNEMLNSAMEGIRQQKVQDTMQRMNQTGQLMSSLGQQGANAIQQQYGRQQQGADTQQGVLAQGAGAEQAMNQAAMGQWQGSQAANQASLDSKQAAKAPSLGEAFGAGLMGSATNIGGSPGKGASSFAGAAGAKGSEATMMSDSALKENIRYADSDIEQLLSNLTPYTYNYKDTNHGAGDFISVMAQDLENTHLGRGLVKNTPEGKMVDYGKALGLILAIQTYLFKRKMT